MGATKKARRARRKRAAARIAALCRCRLGPKVKRDGKGFTRCARCGELIDFGRYEDLLRERYG